MTRKDAIEQLTNLYGLLLDGGEVQAAAAVQEALVKVMRLEIDMENKQ